MRNLLYFFLNIVSLQSVTAQNASDYAFTQEIAANTKEKVSETYASSLANDGSEVEMVFTSLFWFYKSFISSQDGNSCGFHPSCSVYGVECIKRHGMVRGGVMTFDRLARCNGLSPEKYDKDLKRRLLLDPVK